MEREDIINALEQYGVYNPISCASDNIARLIDYIAELTEQNENLGKDLMSANDSISNKLAKIKKLTEENNSLSETVKVRGETIERLQLLMTKVGEDNERLTEENEKLSVQNYMLCPDGTIAMIPTVKSVRTDAVQEVIASIDEMFRRQRYESMWIDKNGAVLGYFDVGDAQECWDGYIKPEIERMLPADVVEVRHGHWEYLWFDAVCSECGYINKACAATRCRTDPPYCPKCGAKMDGAKCENSEREWG